MNQEQIISLCNKYGFKPTPLDAEKIETVFGETQLSEGEQRALLEKYCQDTIIGVLHSVLQPNQP